MFEDEGEGVQVCEDEGVGVEGVWVCEDEGVGVEGVWVCEDEGVLQSLGFKVTFQFLSSFFRAS